MWDYFQKPTIISDMHHKERHVSSRGHKGAVLWTESFTAFAF